MKESLKQLGKKKIITFAAGVIVITALLIGGLVACGTNGKTEELRAESLGNGQRLSETVCQSEGRQQRRG